MLGWLQDYLQIDITSNLIPHAPPKAQPLEVKRARRRWGAAEAMVKKLSEGLNIPG